MRIKQGFFVTCVVFLVASVSASGSVTASSKSADSFVSGRCGGQAPVSLFQDGQMSEQALLECSRDARGQAAPVAARSIDRAAHLNSLTCTATDHDIVVETITDLRIVVASAVPGSVVGVRGQLDINSDGNGDVIVSAEGITVTCASDDAGLVGVPTSAVLWVQADNVTVEQLNIEAYAERGLMFGDRLGTGLFTADNGVARGNRVACERTCISFVAVNGGLADSNDVTAGGKTFGIAASGGSNVTITRNNVSDCLLCIFNSQQMGGVIEGNAVDTCGYACIYAEYSEDGVISNNHVRDASSGNASGIEVESVDSFDIVGNDVSVCDYPCVLVGNDYNFGPNSTQVEIANNTLLDCTSDTSPNGGVCIFVGSTDGADIHNNQLSNRSYAPFPEFPEYLQHPPAAVFYQGSDVLFRENTAERGWALIQSVTDMNFSENSLTDCLEPFVSSRCVLSQFNEGILVSGNLITAEGGDAWGQGIFSFLEAPVAIEGNTVSGSFGEGISLVSGTGQATISSNNIDVLGAADGFGTGVYVEGPDAPLVIEHNRIHVRNEYPDTVGIKLRGQVFDQTAYINGELWEENTFAYFNPIHDSFVANNQVKQAAIGMLVEAACSNLFHANNFKGADTEAVFLLKSLSVEEYDFGDVYRFENIWGGVGDNTSTGGSAITLATPFDAPIVDGGLLDCDDDGVLDPNFFTGPTRTPHLGLGEVIGNIVSATRSEKE